jgi:membrane protease YdiL (CAAX protease family)
VSTQSQAPPGSLPPAGPPRAPWTPLDVLIGLPVAATVLLMLQIPVAAATGADGLDWKLGALVSQDIALVGVAFGFASMRGAQDIPAALGFRRPTPRWAGKVALTYLIYLAFTFTLIRLAGEPEQTDIADKLGFHEGTLAAIAVGLAIVVLAPLTEETFFRGFFFGGLRSRLPFPAAALISAALFGAVHGADVNLIAAVQLAGFGLGLAWLYEETGSIWPSISLHMLNNAVAFTLLVTS